MLVSEYMHVFYEQYHKHKANFIELLRSEHLEQKLC